MRATSRCSCAGLGLALAPHALRAPWWLTLLTAALYRLARGSAVAARPAALALAAARDRGRAACSASGSQYRTIFGRTPGIMLLVLFAGLKVLETRNQRDARGAGVPHLVPRHHQFPLHAVHPDRARHVRGGRGERRRAGRTSPRRGARCAPTCAPRGCCSAQAVPAALVLFLLFPRVQGPLWGLPQDAYSGHDRPVGHDGARQPVAADAVRRDRLPRRFPGRGAAARARSTGADRCCGISTAAPGAWARRMLAELPAPRSGRPLRVLGAARAAQPQLAVRARGAGAAAAARALLRATARS